MAAKYKISLDKGSDKRISFTLKDADGEVLGLAGFTARMQVRRNERSQVVMDDLTTENGRITMGEDSVTVWFPHDVTTGYSFTDAVYDLEIVSPAGEVLRVVQGDLEATNEVTR
jgi:hypothetical protein